MINDRSHVLDDICRQVQERIDDVIGKPSPGVTVKDVGLGHDRTLSCKVVLTKPTGKS